MSDLVDRLFELLQSKNMKLVTAESCTGGLLSATLTTKPGSSAVFDRGFVTYSNEAKIDNLGVDKKIIENAGAVSMECAEAMAQGALEHSNAQLGASITGVAGPDGGTEAKPVGLVYFGYALDGGSTGSLEFHFDGDRQAIRTQAASMVIQHLVSVLEAE